MKSRRQRRPDLITMLVGLVFTGVVLTTLAQAEERVPRAHAGNALPVLGMGTGAQDDATMIGYAPTTGLGISRDTGATRTGVGVRMYSAGPAFEAEPQFVIGFERRW